MCIRDSSRSGFGQYEVCSTAALHCISGPLNLIVPKGLADGAWKHREIHCSTKVVASGWLNGECRSPGVRTSYVFDDGKGLVSYQLQGDHGRSYFGAAKGYSRTEVYVCFPPLRTSNARLCDQYCSPNGGARLTVRHRDRSQSALP